MDMDGLLYSRIFTLNATPSFLEIRFQRKGTLITIATPWLLCALKRGRVQVWMG